MKGSDARRFYVQIILADTYLEREKMHSGSQFSYEAADNRSGLSKCKEILKQAARYYTDSSLKAHFWLVWTSLAYEMGDYMLMTKYMAFTKYLLPSISNIPLKCRYYRSLALCLVTLCLLPYYNVALFRSLFVCSYRFGHYLSYEVLGHEYSTTPASISTLVKVLMHEYSKSTYARKCHEYS
jgi:hypothetical protein